MYAAMQRGDEALARRYATLRCMKKKLREQTLTKMLNLDVMVRLFGGLPLMFDHTLLLTSLPSKPPILLDSSIASLMLKLIVPIRRR